MNMMKLMTRKKEKKKLFFQDIIKGMLFTNY